jgi:alpha-methylacyl-CoA racemase
MPQLNVVALVTNVPGPLAAEHFARRGARVLKIEPPGGDPLDRVAPGWYSRITAGMRVVRHDLKEQAARAEVAGALETADLFISSVRPKALERAGLTSNALTALNPRLCRVAVVGEGGSRAAAAGHDLTYQAVSGLLAPPAMPRTVFADLFAAERAIAAAYRLLFERHHTGTGGIEQVAIADGAAVLADPIRFGLTAEGGPLSGAFAVYRLYRTSDGWIAFAALEAHFQENVRAALGVDPFDASELERIFAQHPSSYWEDLALKFDLPVAAVA